VYEGGKVQRWESLLLVGKRAMECGLDREIGVCWTRGSCGGSAPPSDDGGHGSFLVPGYKKIAWRNEINAPLLIN